MAYPSSIDSFTTKAYGDTVEAAHVNSLQTAVAAIETKVGVTGSSVVDSLDYKLTSSSSANPGHTHTGASLSAITESSITDGSILARVAGNESITGAYTFSNSAGVSITAGANTASGATNLVLGSGGSAGSAVASISFGTSAAASYLTVGHTVSSTFDPNFAFGVNKLLSLKGGLYVGTSFRTTTTNTMTGLGRLTVENPDTDTVAAAYLKNTDTTPAPGGAVLKIDSSVTGTAGDADYNFIEVKSSGYANFLKLRGDGRTYINSDPAEAVSAGTDYYPLTIGNKNLAESTTGMYSALRLYSDADASGTQLVYQDANSLAVANGLPNAISQTYSAGRLDIAFSNNATGDSPSATNIFMPGRAVSIEPVASAAPTTFAASQFAANGYRTANIHLGVSSFLDDSLNVGASSANFYPTSLSANQTTSGVATRVGIGTAQAASGRSSAPEQKIYGNLEVRGRNFSDAEQADAVWPHATGFQFLSDLGGPRRGMVVITDTSTQVGGKTAESGAGGGLYFTHLSNTSGSSERCETPAAIRGILSDSNQSSSQTDGTFGYGAGALSFFVRYSNSANVMFERWRMDNTGNLIGSNARRVWNSASGGLTVAQPAAISGQVQQATTGMKSLVGQSPTVAIHSGGNLTPNPDLGPDTTATAAFSAAYSPNVEFANFFPVIKPFEADGTTAQSPSSATDAMLQGNATKYGGINWVDPWNGSWTNSGAKTVPVLSSSIESWSIDSGVTTAVAGDSSVTSELGTKAFLGQSRATDLRFSMRPDVRSVAKYIGSGAGGLSPNHYPNAGAYIGFKMLPPQYVSEAAAKVQGAVARFLLRKTPFASGYGGWTLDASALQNFGQMWVDTTGDLYYTPAKAGGLAGRVLTGLVEADSEAPANSGSSFATQKYGKGVIITKSAIYVEQGTVAGSGLGEWKKVTLSSL
jgi:hypothetical protein